MLKYTNNFPREDAVKGQEFKGADTLKAELLKRGIISEGGVTAPTPADAKKELSICKGKLIVANKKIAVLEKELVTLREGKSNGKKD